MGGLGYHDKKLDHEQWQQDNPIGWLRGEANYHFDNNVFVGGVVHHESQFTVDDSPGFNYIGGQIGITIK